jgi:hypothetical protein
MKLLLWRYFLLCGYIIHVATSQSYEATCLDAPDARISSMLKVFNDYQAIHNIDIITNEAKTSPTTFCQRKFVYTPTWQCSDFGNSVFGAMNGYIHAVVLNRTYFVNTIACDNLIDYHAWIPRVDTITALLETAQCDMETFIFEARGISNQQLCHHANDPGKVLSFPSQEHTPYKLYLAGGAISLLPPAMAQRIGALFSHPIRFLSNFEGNSYSHYPIIVAKYYCSSRSIYRYAALLCSRCVQYI